jgi:hypothetical protein
MRPYYLDGDLTGFVHSPLRRSGLHRSGDTRFSRRLSMAAECGFCAVFKDRREAYTPAGCGFLRAHSLRDCPTTGGRRSLKTQQHAGIVCGLGRRLPK